MTAVLPGRYARPEPVQPPRSRLLAFWSGDVGFCLRVYLAFRIGLFALGAVVAGLLPHNGDVGVPGWPAPPPTGWTTAVTSWESADALWYLRIGSQGYAADDGSGAFFPLYPLLIRMVGTLTGGRWLLAAYVVSNLALVVALVLLHRLTTRELGASVARKAVLYLCAFPTGFFLFAPYSESLFLALTLGTLYAARTRRWALAAGLGLLAALSRSPGFLLALPLAIEALLQFRASRQWQVLAAGAGAALATVGGLGLYLGFWAQFAGDWRRPFDLQRSGWGKVEALPWETLWAGARLAVQRPGIEPGGYFLVDLAVVVLVLVAGVWVALRTRPTYGLHTWAGITLPLLLMWPGRPLLSLPRIYLVLFPTVWALARLAERFRVHELVLMVSTVSMAVLASMFVSANPLF